MKGARLSPAGHALLVFVAQNGPCPRVALLKAQRDRRDGRTEKAISVLPECMRLHGLMRHKPGTDKLWELTATGRQVLAAFPNPPVERQGRNAWMGATNRAMLEHLARHRVATRPELMAVQLAVEPGRKESALRRLPDWTAQRGWIQRVPNAKPPQWRLTAAGRRALLDVPTAEGVLRQPMPPAKRPGGAVTFAGRKLELPKVARSVFELAAAGGKS